MHLGWWFGLNSGPFFLIANAMLVLFVTVALWRPNASCVSGAVLDGVYAASIFLVLAAWRAPVIGFPYTLNPDEGQLIANALKATKDLVPWRGFDGGTSGPLNSDVVALAALTGTRIDFFSARVVGLLLIGGAICALFVAVRFLYGSAIARVCTTAPVMFLATVRNVDFIHYSSEHVPVFLTAAALPCAAYLSTGRGSQRRRIAVAAAGGIFLGCTPFAKLQVIPIAATVFVYLIVAIFITRKDSADPRGIAIPAAIAAACVPPIIILGTVVIAGEWNDFLTSYVRFAFSYVSGGDSIGPSFFLDSVMTYRCFLGSAFVVFCGCLPLVVLRVLRQRGVDAALLAAGSAVVLLAAAIFAIYEPHREFPHYLLLSVIPITWILANFVGLACTESTVARSRSSILSAYVFIFGVPAISQVTGAPDPFVKDPPTTALTQKPQAAVAAAIGRYVGHGGQIAIWGWMPEYYVMSGTIMATRDSQTYEQIVPSSYQMYFRDRFMRDIRASHPRLIVDAVGPGQFGFSDNAAQGIGSFPRLAALVKRDYTLAEVVDGVQIFRLRDDPR